MKKESIQKLFIFTIGHSNHSIEYFIEILKRHKTNVLIDVRSSPFSRFSPQFNCENLQETLRIKKIKYLFLGNELGGKPQDDSFYDENGFVLYDKIAKTDKFINGISRVIKGAKEKRIVLMCSEANPKTCHRRLLIGKVLGDKGIQIFHILGDGEIISEQELSDKEQFEKDGGQKSLFCEKDDYKWKSIQSVLEKRKQKIFSKN